MRKIIQLVTGMYTYIDEDHDVEEQRFSIVVLCDDNTIWQFKGGNAWENIDTSMITDHIKPRK